MGNKQINENKYHQSQNLKPYDPFNPGKRYIIIMRHGERIDNIDKKKQLLPKEDPELTKKGIDQASSIGKKLKENYFKDIEINEMNILSSPSTRTIMTAIYAANSLNEKVFKNLCFITNLAEIGVNGGFKNNKEESPIYYYINTDNQYKKLWEQFIIKPTKNNNYHFSRFDFASNLNHSENPKEIEDRFKKVMDSILTYSSTCRENTLNLAVTHQLSICVMVEHCFKIMGIEYNSESLHCSYCSTYCFVFNGNKLEYLGDLKPDGL